MGKLKNPKRVMKLPPNTLNTGTMSSMKTTNATNAVAGYLQIPRSMTFDLNWPVTVVNCRRAMSLRCTGMKVIRKSKMTLPNAAA